MDAQERWYRDNVSFKGQIVADVGANVGRLSQFFFEVVGPKGKVISIEPVPANQRAIDKRIKKAGPAGKKRWQLKRCAVAADVGKVTMQVLQADWGTNAVVAEASASTAQARGETVEVAARPLADLAPDATIVKLDVEGHEYAILPGSLEAMPAVEAWLLELHGVAGHPLEATLKALIDHGYRLVAAGTSRNDPQGGWVNVAIEPTLTWDAIPGKRTIRDGVPNVFKMLHVIAKRG